MLSGFLFPVRRRVLLRLAAAVALLSAVVAPRTFAQQATSAAPKVSDQPLSAEQLDVYKFILTSRMNDGPSPLNLVNKTDVFSLEDASDAPACLKGLDLEPYHPVVVHRFRPEDLVQLKPVRLRLVERMAQQKEVEENDPSTSIRRGSSVHSAVENGFAHGYAWLSEIRFDKSHTHAVVSYGFRCGGLCGNGETVVLEKTNGEWKFKSQCSGWIS